MPMEQYELMRIIARANDAYTKKEVQIREIKRKIQRDFTKSIDAECVTINEKKKQMLLITRDKGDERVKKVKSRPDETFFLGDIINWNGTNYIVNYIDADRRIQTKGRMYECNTTLRWKNRKGNIVERVGKGEDATKYSEGVQGGNTVRIGEFQLKVVVRLDEETVLIQRDDRFMIDAFDYIEDIIENGATPAVFRVTRRNVVTGTFPSTNGYVEITLVEDQFVAGHDDVENRIACKRDELIENGERHKDEGLNNDNDTGEEPVEEGWL